MSEIKLDGYCGLYCGACDIRRLSEKSRETGVAAKWAEMPEPLGFKRIPEPSRGTVYYRLPSILNFSSIKGQEG